ncbi:MAG: nitroreductase family protein [Chloroflexi bacterium]|nr:nitroreductase family protein [Chloroflexota bacterium]
MNKANFIPLASYRNYPESEMKKRAAAFYEEVKRRRTVREFSNQPVPREVIEHAILAAGTAPNGANMQPWHFVVVSDASVKKQIRAAAEKEEHEFYTRRATPEWLEELSALGTDEHKPFLETAPYLIAIFEQSYRIMENGSHRKNYYVTESTGIATGVLVTALHHAGLATLTHTPSPMGFLNEILKRPKNEKPFLLLVVGYPSQDATVPDIRKKGLDEIASFI